MVDERSPVPMMHVQHDGAIEQSQQSEPKPRSEWCHCNLAAYEDTALPYHEYKPSFHFMLDAMAHDLVVGADSAPCCEGASPRPCPLVKPTQTAETVHHSRLEQPNP